MPETGPVDSDVLDRIASRLVGSERFASVEVRPPAAPASVVADYDTGYYPAAVQRAYLQVRWYRTDDFSVHYTEQYDDRAWECRWDRHPNDHNARDHFHPPPYAATPGADADYANDWRTVLSSVLDAVDDRVESFWA